MCSFVITCASIWRNKMLLSVLTLYHKHTHTPPPPILSSFLYCTLKGNILMTVNSPDSRALSIFRQYCSAVKWTNTQRMRLLTGLMMPDWLAAADTSGDEDVIYPFLSLSLPHAALSLPHMHITSFGSCSCVVSHWSISLCSVKEEFDSNRITQSSVHFAFVPLDTVAALACCLNRNTQ